MSNMLILITGISGQLGSHMAEECLNRGNKVIGILRRSSAPNLWRIEGILNHPNLCLVEGDGVDPTFINQVISRYRPDIVMNYMAQSHVATSFSQPAYTAEITGKSVLYLLEAIKNFSPNTKLIHAATSEQFGDQFDIDENGIKYQDENTKMNIQSPYGNAKLEAYNYIRLYRNSYNIFATNIIMFNCESPKRGELFVTRKITTYLAKFHKQYQNLLDCCMTKEEALETMSHEVKLKLGNLDASRDWGAASDYIQAYILAANHNKADDFVICTGETYTIKEFLTEAFNQIGIDDWTPFVQIDQSLKRPSEVEYLRGRYTKAKAVLGWEPKIKFKELVKIMVEADIERLK